MRNRVITKSKCFPLPVVYEYGVLTDLLSWWILATLSLNGPAGINPFIDVAQGNTDALQLSILHCTVVV